jgi:aminoglycoside phosphotransferase family enzyme/predicted kinase
MSEPAQLDALRDLLRRVAGADATFIDTHISVLAFGRDHVYKARKPVAFDFVDLSTPDLRLADCHREVELNRRLAPDVYLRVVDLADEHGAVREHAVEMRRMPESQRLTRLLATDPNAAAACIERVAHVLAEFHATAATSRELDALATRDAVAGLWERGFAEIEPFIGSVLDADDARAVERLVRRFLEGRAALFDARVAAGRVRDGHGDLLCDDIFCLPDGPRILDCLEFDDRLRAGDVLADVAFLAMDIEAAGHTDLAHTFLDGYRAAARDEWPASLEHFYIAYRAHVRAKVACLRSAQGDDDAVQPARARLRLARTHLETGRPRLVLIGGLPGTGKSTVAQALGKRHGWRVLRTDEVRKQLARFDASEPGPASYGEGRYAHEQRAATYDALFRGARHALEMGESVVVDASWSEAPWRTAATMVAIDSASELIALQCVAPTAVAHERIARRRAIGGDPSEADERIATLMAAAFDPWPDAREIFTSAPPDETLGTVEAAVR